MSRHHHSSHHGRKNKQLEFLENYLGTIRKEVDEKTRELDALKLEGMHIENAKQFHKFEALTKKKQFRKEGFKKNFKKPFKPKAEGKPSVSKGGKNFFVNRKK